MNSKIGVLITYYNEKELLTRCLESVLAQTRRPDEILIYDDDSAAPAENYVPSGLAVKIVRGAVNRGPSYGRNVLLNLSQCDYVHFHDADDCLRPNWCQRVYQAISEDQLDVIFNEISLDKKGKLYERPVGFYQLISGADLLRFSILTNIYTATGTYRKDKLQSMGGFNATLRNAEDFELHLRLANSGVSYAVIDEPLVTVYLRPSSVARQKLVQNAGGIVAAAAALLDQLPLQYRDDLARKITDEGLYLLLRLGSITGAYEAFRLSYKLSRQLANNQQTFPRLLTKIIHTKLRRKLFGMT